MTRTEAEATAALIRRVLAALLVAAGAEEAGRPGADLRRAAGDLSSEAVALVRSGLYVAPLAACFGLARRSGAGFAAMERVRAGIAAEYPASPSARRVRTLSLIFALVQQSRTLADTTFSSREDVDRVSAAVHAAFGASEDIAAADGDQEAYRGLVSLHADVTRDLTARARPLPRLVTYAFAEPMPALSLAQRLYGDAGRMEEVVAENKIPHPLFAPASGRALSV